MALIKSYETQAQLFIGGMEREFVIRVRYSFWPKVRPSQTNDAEPARVEIHKVTTLVKPGRHPFTRDLIEFDLMPIMMEDQFQSLENEIRMVEEEQ